jgi:hypothetical protein
VIADLSINHVERFALRCGYAIDRVQHDYGLDLMMYTYTSRGEVENGFVWLQLKATDHLRWRKDRQAIIIRIERAHALFWMGEDLPVILIVYDGIKEVAYWLHIQGALGRGQIFRSRRTPLTITLHIPAENIVNEEAMRHIARLKAEVDTETGEEKP